MCGTRRAWTLGRWLAGRINEQRGVIAKHGLQEAARVLRALADELDALALTPTPIVESLVRPRQDEPHEDQTDRSDRLASLSGGFWFASQSSNFWSSVRAATGDILARSVVNRGAVR